VIPGCRALGEEMLFLKRLADEATRTGKPINCHTVADQVNQYTDAYDEITANSIHMRLWRLDIPHTMEMPTPTPNKPKQASRPVRRVEYHPSPVSQAASQHDLVDLADLHKRAFNRLRALERKVATIQENTEAYTESIGDWLCGVIAVLQTIHPSPLVDKLAHSIPHLKHAHVYEWHDGIGVCVCGYTVEHVSRGADDDLYMYSIGSTANRYGRGGR